MCGSIGGLLMKSIRSIRIGYIDIGIGGRTCIGLARSLSVSVVRYVYGFPGTYYLFTKIWWYRIYNNRKCFKYWINIAGY